MHMDTSDWTCFDKLLPTGILTLQIDKLERESAQFPGPHPLLLGSISADDLTYLLSGSDKKTSQVRACNLWANTRTLAFTPTP